jgi:hypothetical protein
LEEEGKKNKIKNLKQVEGRFTYKIWKPLNSTPIAIFDVRCCGVELFTQLGKLSRRGEKEIGNIRKGHSSGVGPTNQKAKCFVC